ncbi:hypothetical protein [Sphingobacterium hungaricum]|nr:hypothetical protein [Sphingobacterium hungaricum]
MAKILFGTTQQEATLERDLFTEKGNQHWLFTVWNGQELTKQMVGTSGM